MPKIFPFKGLVYNKEKVDISSVVCPPYDVISQEEQEEYYKKSPYNIIRLILGKEYSDDTEKNNKYTRARDYLSLWRKEGILIEDKEEAFYLYEQEWKEGDKKGIFRGLICSLELEDYGKNIFPHEKTLSKPKEDRLKLLYATETWPCYIFMIFSDKLKKITNYIKPTSTFVEFEYKKGLFCRLFRMTKNIEEIQKHFLKKHLIIADGHHRYETALRYKKEKGKPRTQVLISDIETGGFVILPAHRLLKDMPDMERISKYFKIEEVEPSALSLLEKRRKRGVFGMVRKNSCFILTLKKNLVDELDVEILHKVLFDEKPVEEGIDYTIDTNNVLNIVNNGSYACGFLLRPTKVLDVLKRAKTMKSMPGKATYFYPKPLCGLVLHPL